MVKLRYANSVSCDDVCDGGGGRVVSVLPSAEAKAERARKKEIGRAVGVYAL